jgi:hypothetical protein
VPILEFVSIVHVGDCRRDFVQHIPCISRDCDGDIDIDVCSNSHISPLHRTGDYSKEDITKENHHRDLSHKQKACGE